MTDPISYRRDLELSLEWQRKNLDDHLGHVVRDLQRAADEIEREVMHCNDPEYAKHITLIGSEGLMAHLAERVQHIVTWALPNMHLYDLPRKAADVDATFAKLEALDLPETEDKVAEEKADRLTPKHRAKLERRQRREAAGRGDPTAIPPPAVRR